MAAIRSVEKAIALIEALYRHREPIGVLQLSRQVGVHPSTAQRTLQTLKSAGYVAQGEDQKYQLGLRLLALGEAVKGRLELRQVARPTLERLARETRETVHLMVRDGTEGMYIDRVDSDRAVRMVSEIGRREPLHCTGVGKALLAFLPPDEQDAILAATGLPRLTPNTLVDRAELDRELATTRESGYSLDLEESEEGICCVGAPVFDHCNRVVGSISVAGPSFRMSRAMLDRVGPLVVAAAREISSGMGCQMVFDEASGQG